MLQMERFVGGHMFDSLIGHGIKVQGTTYEIVGATGGDHYVNGGATVFDVFDLSNYTFLEIGNSVEGKKVLNQTDALGVFKLRTGMNTTDTQETKQSDATLHVKPTESFLKNVPQNREFYRLTLQERKYNGI